MIRRQTRFALQQIRQRRWKYAWRVCRNLLYGFTHLRCKICGEKKLWGESVCIRCQLHNIKALLICDICGCLPWMDAEDCDCLCHEEGDDEA